MLSPRRTLGNIAARWLLARTTSISGRPLWPWTSWVWWETRVYLHMHTLAQPGTIHHIEKRSAPELETSVTVCPLWPLFCNLATQYPSFALHLSSLLFISFSTLPSQCRLMSHPAMCRAQCSWALVWSFSVRTNSVSLLQRIAGTKTTGLWQLQQTLHTLLTSRKERWWENTTIQTYEKKKKNTLFVQWCSP